jgi:hypothetical protein
MIKENLKVLVEYHPFHESIKKKILEDNFNFIRNAIVDGYASNLRAERTVGEYYPKSVDLIKEWVINIIRNDYGGFDYNIDAWVAKYSEGDYAIEHDHIPYAFSYVYFVNTPKGSSPLVFSTSGKRIKAEEGKVIIFPGSLRHYVPKNRCEGRVTIAGNVCINN